MSEFDHFRNSLNIYMNVLLFVLFFWIRLRGKTLRVHCPFLESVNYKKPEINAMFVLFFQGLIPGKNYSYRVQSGSNTSEGFEFTVKRDDEVGRYG